jgi:hypothetical protein
MVILKCHFLLQNELIQHTFNSHATVTFITVIGLKIALSICVIYINSEFIIKVRFTNSQTIFVPNSLPEFNQ